MIVVLARAPSSPGKTRLTAGLPDDAARLLRTALLRDTLEVVASADPDAQRAYRHAVAFTPSEAREEIAALAPGAILWPQRGADLGDRMFTALADAFAAGAARAVLIGSDLPTLPASHITDALARLADGADCVFGPAEDGGYYLIGANRRAIDDGRLRAVFAGIAWGCATVLADSLAAAARVGLRTAQVARWSDVDTRADLERAFASAPPDVARHSRSCRDAFLQSPGREPRRADPDGSR